MRYEYKTTINYTYHLETMITPVKPNDESNWECVNVSISRSGVFVYLAWLWRRRIDESTSPYRSSGGQFDDDSCEQFGDK